MGECMRISDLLKYYNQDEIIDEVMRLCQNREVIPKYNKGYFGERPSTFLYERDFLNAIRRGAVSFHFSVERWRNPLSLAQSNSKSEMDDLRSGWDLVFDIDTKVLDYARVCTELICEALEFHNVSNYSIKYSGGTGFHVGVPFESFPRVVNGEDVKRLFPVGAQRVAIYVSDMIEDKLASSLLEFQPIETISERTGKKVSELVKDDGDFNPYEVIEIDTIAISPRHLMRMPYSVNEKKNRVSLPLKKEEVSGFNPEDAKVSNASYNGSFLNGESSEKGEARELFVQAFDWYNKKIRLLEEKEERRKRKDYRKNKGKYEKSFYRIPEEDYPPCVKNIMKGLEDGRKRALFILINYFRSANYDFEEIERIVREWNEKNQKPLRGSYVNSQLKWSKNQPGEYLPPNCNSLMYYKDIRVCEPDEICERIKNPLNYSYLHYKRTKHKRRKED